MEFDEFLHRVDNLRRARVNGQEMPYKPVLLTAVVLLIQKRKIRDRRIFLDGALRSAFAQAMEHLFPNWAYTPNIKLPFRHLESDGIWTLAARSGAIDDLVSARALGAGAASVLKHVECAELDAAVFARLARSSDARIETLRRMVLRYLPQETAGWLWRVWGDNEFAASLSQSTGALLERALEEHLERHWDGTPFARDGISLCSRERDGLAGRQVLTPVNSIDLLGYRRSDDQWWVFELKRGRPSDAVVGQVSRYVGWLRSEKGQAVRGAIIAREIDSKLRYAAAAAHHQLWQFDEELRLHQVA